MRAECRLYTACVLSHCSIAICYWYIVTSHTHTHTKLKESFMRHSLLSAFYIPFISISLKKIKHELVIYFIYGQLPVFSMLVSQIIPPTPFFPLAIKVCSLWLFATYGLNSLPGSLCLGDSSGKNTGVSAPMPSSRGLLDPESNSCFLHFLHWEAGSLPLVPPFRKDKYTRTTFWQFYIKPILGTCLQYHRKWKF